MADCPPPDTHPLLPGIRTPEVWNRDWPRSLHDKQITGFSPLTCGMTQAPSLWAALDVGGEMSWARCVPGPDGPLVVVDDGRIRAVDFPGQVRWETPVSGELLFAGDLGRRGDGALDLLIGQANRLFVLDGVTGETRWEHTFDPPHVRVRAAVGQVLPDRSGRQVAVFLAYGETGCLLDFTGGSPEWVWNRPVVVDGEWPERADHGCSIQLDLSIPDEPLIWNVRHHRCRAFDARTGDMVSSLVYELGGGQRRNYGPWSFGTGRDGHTYICVVAEQVQTHVHALRLARSGASELAWQRYYGEVYVVPGVAVQRAAVADLDGDGSAEVAYTARDPERDFRSFVRVRRVDTGEIAAEWADTRCLGALPGLGPAGEWGLLVEPVDAAPSGPSLAWLSPSGRVQTVPLPAEYRLWGQPVPDAYAPGQLLLRRSGTVQSGQPGAVAPCVWSGAALAADRHHSGPDLAAATPRLFLGHPPVSAPPSFRDPLYLVEEGGRLSARTWSGEARWHLQLSGGPAAAVSAADLDGDGRAELVAAAPGEQAQVIELAVDGTPRVVAAHPYSAPRGRLSPLLYDLESTGHLSIVAPDRGENGQPLVRTWRGDGSLVWETCLPVPGSAGASVIAWNAGDFLGPAHAGVAASVTNPSRTVEGTFLLDGRDGRVVWHRERVEDGDAIRGFYPAGLPTAVDVDGDGIEEIGIDCLSYMGYVRGRDGSFTLRHHSPNIRAEGALYAAQLYNSFCPVYPDAAAVAPHWFVPLGYGTFGLMHPDPTTGIWREEAGYDVPPRVGMVDVDGDGRLEVGYALLNHRTFVCRDLWTGVEKWRLDLPEPPDAPVIAADVDGDGRGEFLIGRWCIGTDARGLGQVRWEAPVPMAWAAIADVDGDGLGEIICAGAGKLFVLKGSA